MTRLLLMRGMLAGIVAGLLVFTLARWIGEPQVERAIAFETNMDKAKGEAPEPEIVSRTIQRSMGLLTATVVDGTAMGGIFALVFAFAYGRVPVTSPRTLSILLAGLGFVVFAVVPTLKYPANPPSVGNPETIGMRTAAFFLLLTVSVAAMVFAVQIERRFHSRLGAWNAVLLAVVLFIIVMVAVSPFSSRVRRGAGRLPGNADVEVPCRRSGNADAALECFRVSLWMACGERTPARPEPSSLESASLAM
jgi:Probable cobalt transporter subunit (CbtA)